MGDKDEFSVMKLAFITVTLGMEIFFPGPFEPTSGTTLVIPYDRMVVV